MPSREGRCSQWNHNLDGSRSESRLRGDQPPNSSQLSTSSSTTNQASLNECCHQPNADIGNIYHLPKPVGQAAWRKLGSHSSNEQDVGETCDKSFSCAHSVLLFRSTKQRMMINLQLGSRLSKPLNSSRWKAYYPDISWPWAYLLIGPNVWCWSCHFQLMSSTA